MEVPFGTIPFEEPRDRPMHPRPLSHPVRTAACLLMVLVAGNLAAGCATGLSDGRVGGESSERRSQTQPPGPLPENATLHGTGIASWYGGKFHGRPTASGEIFNKWDHTAAHRTLPLGTRVLVEHRRTGRRVRVKINDRGPFVKGRIIDLSRGAAARIDMVQDGTAPVRLYVLGGDTEVEEPVPPKTEGVYTIQVGSFENENNARRLRDKLSTVFDKVSVTAAYDRYHRVRVGEFDSRADAGDTLRRLHDRGLETWMVFESR